MSNARLLPKTAIKESRQPQNYPQLEDGGMWVQCTQCDTYKRHDRHRAGQRRIVFCQECGSDTDHVPNKPSYAI